MFKVNNKDNRTTSLEILGKLEKKVWNMFKYVLMRLRFERYFSDEAKIFLRKYVQS